MNQSNLLYYNVKPNSNQFGGSSNYYVATDLELAKSNGAEDTPLIAGDLVQLADNFSANGGYGWCLGKAGAGSKKVGVVLRAAVKGDQQTQSDVAVASLDDLSKYYYFDSSWLVRSPIEPKSCIFRTGDRVQLRTGYSNKLKEEADCNKCLGRLSDAVYGIVVNEGVIRDGIARNVEVVAVGGPNDGSVSLYPGYCLRLADRPSVLVDSDEVSDRYA